MQKDKNKTSFVWHQSLNWFVHLSFLFSVEVNNFLKIDENQNEEVESELSDSPVSIWVNFLFYFTPHFFFKGEKMQVK